jgi:putative Mn2+ efflux pump MntP
MIQRRRLLAQPALRPAPRGFEERLPQSLFALLLAAAWAASLGLSKPLAAFDHWIAFVVLGGLGWKLIHGAVRPGGPPRRPNARLIYAVLVLAALTSTRAFLVEYDLSLAIVPVIVLLAAVAVIACAPFLTRPGAHERLQRIGQHRVEIAGGLILIGIALKTLIEHLA